jgi:YidC/Oxa1 family membrane protein insertase
MIVAGILSPLERLLTWGLTSFHEALSLPWGWSVVALTIVVRMLLVPLAVRQIHSMQALQAHAPEMKAIQQRYKQNRQKQNEELMKFYRENKINPAASCLPIVAQIPIFIALFFVLRDFEDEVYSKPEYQGTDLGWLGIVPNIADGITGHWSGFLLLGIYVVSQLASGYFMSTSMQGTQRVLLLVLPIVFVPFIIDPPGSTVFPVGLLMYWMTTNLWTVGQGLITRRLMPKREPPPKRSSRTPPRVETDAADRAQRDHEPTAAAAGTAPARRRVKRKKKARR